MKNYLRQIILFIIGFLLIIGLYIVDVVFYRIPNFIKVFRIEREVAVVVAIFLIFPLLKALYIHHITTIKQKGFSFLLCLFGLLMLLYLPHLLFEKYIILWDNNPMLAEFPAIWNIYSVLIASVFAIILLFFLQIIKNLVVTTEIKFSLLIYNFMFLTILVGSGLLNIIEDRYLYQPVLDGYLGLFNDYKIGIYLFLILSVGISLRGNWIDELNQKEKIIGFVGGIFIVLLSIILFGSQHIVAVYAFSTTLKGIILIGYLFVFVFFVISILKLLFHLPTAAKIDRVSQELEYIVKIENMIKTNNSIDSIVNAIIDMSSKITSANGCWMEIAQDDNSFKIVDSLNINEDLVLDIGSFTIDDLKTQLVKKQKACLINNIASNSMTKHFKLLDCHWKSMLAIPFFNKNKIIGILYVVKNKFNGFSKQDEKTLNRFLAQIEKVFYHKGEKNIIKREIENIHIEKNNYLVDVIIDGDLVYDSIYEGLHFDCCVFGISNDISGEKIGELRGMLKVLMKLNNKIEPIITPIKELLSLDYKDKDYIFLFISTSNGKVTILKSNYLYYSSIENNEHKNLTSHINEEICESKLFNWGVFKFRKDNDIDLSQYHQIIDNSKNNYLSNEILINNLHLLFGEKLNCKDFIFIQKKN